MVYSKQVIIIGEGQEISYEMIPALEQNGFLIRNFLSAEHFFNSNFRPHNTIYFVDCHLTGITGHDVVRTIRQQDKLSAIILLRSCTDPACTISAFKNGADCYVSKPLNMVEIIERIKSAHTKLIFIRKSIKTDGIILLPETCSVSNNGLSVDLTSREFMLFKYLYKNLGSVCTREVLIQELKSEKGMAVRNIDFHISTLRKKLLNINVAIDTVWKVGYRLKSSNI